MQGVSREILLGLFHTRGPGCLGESYDNAETQPDMARHTMHKGSTTIESYIWVMILMVKRSLQSPMLFTCFQKGVGIC